MSLTIAALNHLLAQNPELRQRLARLSPGSFSLSGYGLSLHAAIDPDGYLQGAAAPTQTDILIKAEAVNKLLLGQTPGVGDVHIGGDRDLGMALLPVLSELRYHPNADLARVFGHSAAGMVMSGAHKGLAVLKDSKSRLDNDFRQYVNDGNGLLVGKNEMARLNTEIARLRDDVARLAAKIALLETKTMAPQQ